MVVEHKWCLILPYDELYLIMEWLLESNGIHTSPSLTIPHSSETNESIIDGLLEPLFCVRSEIL